MRRFDLDADLLKVGHHGSRYSTTAGFLDAVAPDWAVIQVGQNNYGHPAESVLQLLKDEGVQVYRNDEHGTVTFLSDGQAFYLSQ
jgi:beta-lactamase superfamily II metal-dependent hydrolase